MIDSLDELFSERVMDCLFGVCIITLLIVVAYNIANALYHISLLI